MMMWDGGFGGGGEGPVKNNVDNYYAYQQTSGGKSPSGSGKGCLTVFIIIAVIYYILKLIGNS